MSPDLPTDPAALRALVLQEREQMGKVLASERAAHERTRQQRDRFKWVLQEMIRRYFGRSSEKVDPNQLNLAIAAVEADQVIAEAQPPSPPKPPRSPSQRRARRLEDLPLLETITIDLPPEEKTGPDGAPLVKIGEEITEEVDYQPGKLFRRRIVRLVYASPAHACPPRTAELPARERIRSLRSVPVLIKLQQAMLAAAADPAVLPQSGLGKALSYALARWPELTRFADPGYGHLLIDNNPTERQIRPSKLGLKNWIFVGHPDAGDRPAVLYSVLGTCKLLGVDP